MKPLLCFYENNQYFSSEDYLRIECPDEKEALVFLKEIEKKYFSELKILQINFEFENQNLFTGQETLYPAAKATVFILQKYSLIKLNSTESNESSASFLPMISKGQFLEKTNYIIEQIKQGRIYQANLTAPLQATSIATAESLFRKYQQQFKGEYKALLPLAQVDLLSFSPELFLEQKNNVLKTRPIKGSLHQNANFANDLLANAKEDAELSMIVDLLRNDLNSLSNDHSAQVTAHREKMQLGYIQHTFSEIVVENTKPLSYVLEKTFPGGSISGCPKIESLKVIREVESYKRQAYTGSLGWWKENDFCLNIAIRTLIKHQDNLFYHSGCGIVFDSNAEAEWEEFLLKTGSLNVR